MKIYVHFFCDEKLNLTALFDTLNGNTIQTIFKTAIPKHQLLKKSSTKLQLSFP